MNRSKNIPIQQICQLYSQGFSAPQIGRIFNVSETTIRRRLEQIGMPRRKDFNGINSPRWNPDAWYVMKGYKYIKAPKGHPHAIHRAGKHRNAWYIAEHRLVMEQKIERYLLPTEIVHHINHNRLDNRPENLELAKNQKEHFNHHREVFERQKVIFKGKHFSPETEFKKKS